MDKLKTLLEMLEEAINKENWPLASRLFSCIENMIDVPELQPINDGVSSPEWWKAQQERAL